MLFHPNSDLKNKFTEIVQYLHLGDDIESKLDEADKQAAEISERYTLEDIAQRIKERINEK